MIYELEYDSKMVQVEIEYDFDGGYWEYPHPDTPSARFWVPGEIELDQVSVIWIEGFDSHGNTVYTLPREQIDKGWLKTADNFLFNIITQALDDPDNPVCDAIHEDAA